MKYKLTITDHFGRANLYLKEALTEELKKAIETISCVAKVETFEDYPQSLKVYKTTDSSLENLALQLYKLLSISI